MIAEGYGLFAVDRVRIGTGNVDGFPYIIINPAHIVQEIHPRIRDGAIVGGVLPRPCRQSGQRIKIYNMRGSVRQHMRSTDEGNGFLNGHVLHVDIACPNVTDALLALQIVFSDVFQDDGGVFKMLCLPLGCIPAFRSGIKNHKG